MAKYNISASLLKKILIIKTSDKISGKNKIIFKKSDIILKNFISIKLLIYKGYFYRNININKFIIGYKFGEFAYTRKPFRFLLKSKSNK